jgi:polyhydroxybutyrate depolymerase
MNLPPTATRILTNAPVMFLAFLFAGCVIPGSTPLAKRPQLTAAIERGVIRVGGLERTFLAYVPRSLPTNAPLVFVLHGAMQNAQMMRVSTGYEFERLADQHGFLVVYPNGYEKHWNDCRKQASYSARKRAVDDKGFLLALIEEFHSTHRIDRTRVFAMGYSNGGHLAYRLALELPERVTAIAVVGANLPTDENCDCQKAGRPIPVMVMNGTRDPINPYHGGSVTLFGFANRGAVLSARQSAEYFVHLNELEVQPEVSRLAPQGGSSSASVETLTWHAVGKPEVALVSIKGGGHVVPQPAYRAPFLFGQTSRTLDGPEVIWNFFARQRPLESPDHARLSSGLVPLKAVALSAGLNK